MEVMNIKKYKYYRVPNIRYNIELRDAIWSLHYYGYMNKPDRIFNRDTGNRRKTIYKAPLSNGIGVMTYDIDQTIKNISFFKTFRNNLMKVSKHYTSFKNKKRSNNKH